MHLQGVVWHFGHLLLYFVRAAFSRLMLVTFASEASHAMTSANSFSNACLSLFCRASPSS